MLAYYSPTNRGVEIKTGESGTFPAELWVGNHYGLHGLPNNSLSLISGVIGLADSDQILMRRASTLEVVLVSAATTDSSGIWRWKTQEELDAEIAANDASVITQMKTRLIVDRVIQLSRKSVTQLLKKSDWRLA